MMRISLFCIMTAVIVCPILPISICVFVILFQGFLGCPILTIPIVKFMKKVMFIVIV